MLRKTPTFRHLLSNCDSETDLAHIRPATFEDIAAKVRRNDKFVGAGSGGDDFHVEDGIDSFRSGNSTNSSN